MYTDHLFRDERGKGHLVNWTGSSFVLYLSNWTWRAFQAINRRLPEGELPHPKWAPGKILKSHERSAPPLGFPRDVAVITDTARGRVLTAAQLALSILRNYRANQAPKGFPISQILNLFKRASDRSDSDRNDRMRTRTDQDDWRVLCVEGMWFQDLWNYDFRRTEMCVIPYGTQEGEISFCAYNTGVGWRQIIENMHQTASLAEWHKTQGRHEIFAKGKKVQLPTTQHHLLLPVIQGAPAAGGCSSHANPAILEKDREILEAINSGPTSAQPISR